MSKTFSQILNNNKAESEFYLDNDSLKFFIDNDFFYRELIRTNLKNHQLRCIVEVTLDNTDYCKTLGLIIDDIRHNPNLIGNIILNDEIFVSLLFYNEIINFEHNSTIRLIDY